GRVDLVIFIIFYIIIFINNKIIGTDLYVIPRPARTIVGPSRHDSGVDDPGPRSRAEGEGAQTRNQRLEKLIGWDLRGAKLAGALSCNQVGAGGAGELTNVLLPIADQRRDPRSVAQPAPRPISPTRPRRVSRPSIHQPE